MTTTFSLPRPTGFSLGATSAFTCSFTPGRGSTSTEADRLTVSLRLDGTFEPVLATLAEKPDRIAVTFTGTRHRDVVEHQLGRIFGLEVDGDAWWNVGRRDPLARRLQEAFPGFFTVTKTSPYDAAAWGVLSPRMPMTLAANLKEKIAKTYGDRVELAGVVHHVFPSPRAVLEMPPVEGLPEEKRLRLRAVAQAALEGRLDADRLRAMHELDAIADLQTIRGVGPWTASHIFYRGAAPHDALPTAEPRVLHGFAEATGVDIPSFDAFAARAEAWRPFRMWMSVLLSRALAATGGWKKRGLRDERAEAGKAIGRAAKSRKAGRTSSLTAG